MTSPELEHPAQIVDSAGEPGTSSVVVLRDTSPPRSRAYLIDPGVLYFSRYAWSMADFRRSLLVWTARTGISRPATWIAPCGSRRNVRYQLRGLRLHERTKTRPSTTTAQIPMKRCGCVPARMPRIFPSRITARTSSGKRRCVPMIFLRVKDTLPPPDLAEADEQPPRDDEEAEQKQHGLALPDRPGEVRGYS